MADLSHECNYRPSEADPNVWICPLDKPNGYSDYEMVLYYVDDVLSISHDPCQAIESIKEVFKLKNDKTLLPDMYLGANLKMVKSTYVDCCWCISSEKYVKFAILTIEEKLQKSNQTLPKNCVTSLSCIYHPAMDESDELDSEDITFYQGAIGMLCGNWIY